MRLLHTADWHLGRAFHGEDLLRHQAAWVDWAVEVARASDVDGVLVAGDLYDRALPPVDAVRLADEALARLADVAPVVVISGNHDSPQRLRFGARLLSGAGLHLRTDPLDVAAPVPLGDGVVFAIPYLEPDVVRPLLSVEGRGHTAVLTAAMDRVRAALPGADVPSCVMAHAFVAGAYASESERDLSVGGAPSVAADVFAGVGYAALGHIHAPQAVASIGRYAGSPLAFSFSEEHQTKSVAVVEVVPSGWSAELVACPVPRAVRRLTGTLDELLADPALAAAEDAWVAATLTDPVRPAEAMERLRRRFPHAVALAFAPTGAVVAGEGGYAARLRGLADEELAARFVADVRGGGPDDEELALLRDALAAHRLREAVA